MTHGRRLVGWIAPATLTLLVWGSAAVSAPPAPPGAAPAPADTSTMMMAPTAQPPAPAPAPAAPKTKFKAYTPTDAPAVDPYFPPADAEPFKPAANVRAAARVLDGLILEDARERKLEPAPLIGDEAFLRRASIDLIGRIPTAREFEAYLADAPDQRREKLIARLLDDDRFVVRMTAFFDDMLRVRTSDDGGTALRAFVAQSLRDRVPYDQMVRQMLTAQGMLTEPSVGYLVSEGASPLTLPGTIAQQFMGVRISCAQCHDHPFDAWTQEQYYSLAAFFARTNVYKRDKPYLRIVVNTADRPMISWPKELHNGKATGEIVPQWPFRVDEGAAARPAPRSAPVRSAEAEVEALAAAPRTLGLGKLDAGLTADFQARAQRDVSTADPGRQQAAALLTSPRNRYFAWNIVNRVWAEMLGSGVVQPVDDFRSGNPPRNPRLLNRLADEFVASGYDLRFLVEMIVRTEAYQRARLAAPADDRRAQERAFVAAPVRRMNAEALYDSLITAGHLERHKHREGANLISVTFQVRDRVLRPEAKAKLMAGGAGETMMAAAPGNAPANAPGNTPGSTPATSPAPVPADAYSAEDVDAQINDALQNPHAGGMAAMADLRKEAAQEMQTAKIMASEENVEYVTRSVTQIRDDNPRFDPAWKMPTPASSEHLLRQLGQPSRATVGEKRETSANVRQSLILLNGKLVNEAARVGDYEPLDRFTSDRQPLEGAIDLAYAEALSRRPTSREREAAAALIQAAPDRREGIADLRWVLFNSLEFRYLP